MDTMKLHGKLELVRHVLAKVRLPEEIQSLPERMDDALTGHEGLFVNISKPDGVTIFATPDAFFPEALVGGAASTGLSGYPETVSWQRDGHGYRGVATDASTEASELPFAVVAIAISTDQHHRFMALFYRGPWVAIAMGILSTGVLGWLAATRGSLRCGRCPQRPGTSRSAG
jgi:two-component system heavy metal sensor histidine kinase CusS